MHDRLIIILILLVAALYLILRQERMVWIRSSSGRKTYYVKNLKDAQRAADKLEELENHLADFMQQAEKIYPGDVRIKRIRERWDGSLSEVEDLKDNIAYSIGKMTLHLCIREKDGRTADINSCMFVLLHELAHICTISYGHTTEFWKNMRFLLEIADFTGHYEYTDNVSEKTMLCGRPLGSSPMTCVRTNTCPSELRR